MINDIVKGGIKRSNILYFNVENDEIDLKSTHDLNLILNTYFEIVSFNRKETYFVFLDEIQEIENWEKFVRKVLDEFENIQIIIT